MENILLSLEGKAERSVGRSTMGKVGMLYTGCAGTPLNMRSGSMSFLYWSWQSLASQHWAVQVEQL